MSDYPPVWPADGFYEVGTVAAQANYSAITAWAKDRPDVTLNKTWALEVRGDSVTVHEYAWDEDGRVKTRRNEKAFGGVEILYEKPRKVPL